MLKALNFAIVGVFLSSGALTGEVGAGGCFDVEYTASAQQSIVYAPTTAPATTSTAAPTTTAQTSIRETAKPESKS